MPSAAAAISARDMTHVVDGRVDRHYAVLSCAPDEPMRHLLLLKTDPLSASVPDPNPRACWWEYTMAWSGGPHLMWLSRSPRAGLFAGTIFRRRGKILT